MNKIFTLRSPLYIKYPNGETRVIEEIFQHPEGILYFELFWEKDPRYGIHLIKGKITGDGPWRVGECSFHLLGCNHTHHKCVKCTVFGSKNCYKLKPI
ncbi:hypothetical protein BSPWISOXPB_8268 [uncultured Gammaproteobacteria bacterium]|nr:hypothetical protein BSPWISOXPB_8268 [uncultured Gammaproteobacteria bacterium]